MFTIASQNVHQATPAVLAVMKEEALNADARGFVLPVPLTTIFFKPWQRVNLWPELRLSPFHLFLDGLATIAPFELDALGGVQTPTGGMLAVYLAPTIARLKADRLAAVPIPMQHVLGSSIQYAHALRNADGALDLFAATVDADLVGGVLGTDPVRLSLVQELLAAELGCPMGVLYQVATSPRITNAEADRVFAIEGTKEDPWITDDGEPIPDEYRVPIRSLPLGRWTRELSTLLKSGSGCGELVDPWLEGVARPLWKAQEVYREPIADRVGAAQRELVGVAARDWAQAAWEWLEAQRGQA